MSTGLRFTLEVDGLPPDAFAVVSFHLNQSLSSLFSLDLSLVSQQFLSLEFAQVLDKMAYLTIWQGDEVQRRVKGVVTWFELGENDKNQMLYSMKVHPPLWRAGLRQNFRIFQNEDIKSILGTMLQENGVTEWSPLFSEPHPSREFCVQYGETDYDFLCRMAAEEGIFFYEEHAYKSTDQSLVLCDTVRHLPESFEIPWNPNTRTEVSTLCISQFRYSAQIRPSSVVTKDYTFKRPGWPGRFDQEGQYQDYQRTQYEVYDYPGRFKGAHGQNFARWQMDGWRNNAEVARGTSRSPEIWPGRRIVLTGHPQANLNREWQVVASELHGEQPQAVPGRSGSLPLSFTRFHCSVLPLHGLTGVGWSDSWSEYAWVREQGKRVDIISLGATLNFAFDGESDTAVNPYHAQYILRRRDDYLELFDRDALSSRFFYDAFPGMRLRHPVTDDTSDDRLAHSPADRMYMLGGMSDTASNRITFERDSQYRITGVSHTDGIRLKLTYHASGYLKAIHRTDNGIQTLATYEQDARGRLTEADARLDYHLFYEYDAADRIIRWSDNDQTWSRFTYDEQGRCVTVTGAEGYYNATLDYGDGCTTLTDGKGTHRYYYDPDGNILREEAPDGSTTTYEWDEFHHLLARHSPAGRVEKFEYNAAHGQLSRYTAADGAEWQYRYDERGLLSNITDPAGQTWTQQCDERGLPVSLVSPQGEETRLAYTAQGLLSGIFRQDERRLGIEYDHHNRPETLTDVMGREHHTEYSGHDPRAMLYNAVQHQWLTEQQTGEIWRQYVPHQFLFAEILTTLGHINRSAINVLLLRHERSSLPLGKFLVTEGVISQETLDRVLTIQRELQVSMQSLLLKAGLNTEQVAQLESENEGE
ncbi:TPA: type VI secretion system tip protein TssI/VgrG [Escherichia coli]|uniref:type VI secretion system tip protein TssI/VgrG n=1 Tax=Escherichia coli TaxID=562 RepID=UPI001CDA971A|nr:type VI secretion system tip protein TssI/VgrG [Escherichia coli]HAW9015925.1 type VI secretion system tip protein VgrG [Escherichia coli]